MSQESLNSGDWVLTNSSAMGHIMFVSRLFAFVDVKMGKSSFVATYRLRELTKIDEPQYDNEGV